MCFGYIISEYIISLRASVSRAAILMLTKRGTKDFLHLSLMRMSGKAIKQVIEKRIQHLAQLGPMETPWPIAWEQLLDGFIDDIPADNFTSAALRPTSQWRSKYVNKNGNYSQKLIGRRFPGAGEWSWVRSRYT